jgi:hypothetical protein
VNVISLRVVRCIYLKLGMWTRSQERRAIWLDIADIIGSLPVPQGHSFSYIVLITRKHGMWNIVRHADDQFGYEFITPKGKPTRYVKVTGMQLWAALTTQDMEVLGYFLNDESNNEAEEETCSYVDGKTYDQLADEFHRAREI